LLVLLLPPPHRDSDVALEPEPSIRSYEDLHLVKFEPVIRSTQDLYKVEIRDIDFWYEVEATVHNRGNSQADVCLIFDVYEKQYKVGSDIAYYFDIPAGEQSTISIKARHDKKYVWVDIKNAHQDPTIHVNHKLAKFGKGVGLVKGQYCSVLADPSEDTSNEVDLTTLPATRTARDLSQRALDRINWGHKFKDSDDSTLEAIKLLTEAIELSPDYMMVSL
jgi:hypothetical protein